ncbi:MAG: tetratricopeptide repeat protein, partial [Sphingobacteriales bacterium]
MADAGCFADPSNKPGEKGDDKRMKKIAGILIWIACSIAQAFGQDQGRKENVRSELRKGNALYAEQKYDEAQNVYREALKKDPTSYTGMFNMGDALYRGKQFAPAREAMDASAKTTTDKMQQAHAYHNIGNTWLEEKKWEEAIAAYKQALRLNPTDTDTKYNLAYAQAMLKKNGGDKNNKDKDKKNKDKKAQDKKDKDKKDQDKQDQDKQDKDKKDQEQQDQDKKNEDNKQ